MRDFIHDFVYAWKVARGATTVRNELYNDLRANPNSYEAITHYRNIWPKTPYTCCDDSHEAGWVQGFTYSRNLTKRNKDGI